MSFIGSIVLTLLSVSIFVGSAWADGLECEDALCQRMRSRVAETMGYPFLSASDLGDDFHEACFTYEPSGVFVPPSELHGDRVFLLHHEMVHARRWFRMMTQYSNATAAQCCFQGDADGFGSEAELPESCRHNFINNEITATHRSHRLLAQMARLKIPHTIRHTAENHAIISHNLAGASAQTWRFVDAELERFEREGTFPDRNRPRELGPDVSILEFHLPKPDGGRIWIAMPVPTVELSDPRVLMKRARGITEAWLIWLRLHRR